MRKAMHRRNRWQTEAAQQPKLRKENLFPGKAVPGG